MNDINYDVVKLDEWILFSRTFYTNKLLVDAAIDGLLSLRASPKGLIIPPLERERISFIKSLYDNNHFEDGFFKKRYALMKPEAFFDQLSDFNRELAFSLEKLVFSSPDNYFNDRGLLLLNDSLFFSYLKESLNLVVNDNNSYFSSLDDSFDRFVSSFRIPLSSAIDPVTVVNTRDLFYYKSIYSSDPDEFIANISSLRNDPLNFTHRNFSTSSSSSLSKLFKPFVEDFVKNIFLEKPDGLYFNHYANAFLLKRLLSSNKAYELRDYARGGDFE